LGNSIFRQAYSAYAYWRGFAPIRCLAGLLLDRGFSYVPNVIEMNGMSKPFFWFKSLFIKVLTGETQLPVLFLILPNERVRNLQELSKVFGGEIFKEVDDGVSGVWAY
jgi:hypothetical protein